MHIGPIIRSLREERGWTQSELAQRADVEQSYLSCLETTIRGKRVDGYALARLALALDVDLEEIFLRAGVYPTDDLQGELRVKKLQRLWRRLPAERQEVLMVIGEALLSLGAPAQAQAGVEDSAGRPERY